MPVAEFHQYDSAIDHFKCFSEGILEVPARHKSLGNRYGSGEGGTADPVHWRLDDGRTDSKKIENAGLRQVSPLLVN
jgi:hypothetical protein